MIKKKLPTDEHRFTQMKYKNSKLKIEQFKI